MDEQDDIVIWQTRQKLRMRVAGGWVTIWQEDAMQHEHQSIDFDYDGAEKLIRALRKALREAKARETGGQSDGR